MRQLASTVALILEARIALQRINKFLMAEDLKDDYITENRGGKNAVAVRNGNFYWLTEKDKKLKKIKEEEEEEKKQKDEAALKRKTRKERKKEERKRRQANKDLEEEKRKAREQEKSELTDTGYRLIIEDVNVEIKKGAFVAILGEYF